LKINNFCIVAFFTLLIYSIVLFFYYNTSQNSAIYQAELVTKDLLRQIKSLKTFFNDDQKIQIKKLIKNQNKDIFIPELYSCTYASKQINNYYNELRANKKLPSIKISYIAKNPRNFENQAFGKELELLKAFNSGEIQSYKKIIDTKDGKYLYFAKPTTKMNKNCLECHGNPKDAPLGLVKKYGKDRGFYNKSGEIRAFIKVLMPLDKYLSEAKKLFWTIAIATFIILISIIILVRLFVTKNKKESQKFQKVIDTLDEMILVKSNHEVHSMNRSFLKFFGLKDLSEFKKDSKCLSNYFIKENGYMNIDLENIDDKLIKTIENTNQTKRVVKIANYKGVEHTLTIKIDKPTTLRIFKKY